MDNWLFEQAEAEDALRMRREEEEVGRQEATETYVATEKFDEILENLYCERPTEIVFRMTDSGREKLLTKIQNQEEWIVFGAKRGNILWQLAEMLKKAGFGDSANKVNPFFDIGVEIEKMLQNAKNKGKTIIILLDELLEETEKEQLRLEHGRWMRLNYPVYMVIKAD